MLTGKLYTAVLAAGSLFFMAATTVNYSSKKVSETSAASQNMQQHDSTCKNMHEFDSTGLCSCLAEIPADELMLAPRIRLHKKVAGFVHDYLKVNGFFLERTKPKAAPYFELIDSVFTDYELPVELKYLAYIESGLNSQVGSRAGAAGLWELMPVAAKKFGLTVNRKTDERKDVFKSTAAAAKCLIYLHNMFDDWLLTLAAYNSGPGRVVEAIRRSGSRDFWVLQNFLPEETRKHVRKFIAVHYYFEGHGSLVTLTKKETKAHVDAVASLLKKQELQKTDTSMLKTVAIDPATQ